MSNKMTSFRSQHYPTSSQSFRVMQEYAIRYYAVFIAVVMTGVMIKMYYGQPLFWFGVLGMAGAVLLGNAVAYVTLRKRIAEILFVGDSISIISVSDIVFKEPTRSFPLRLANPSRTQDTIQLHFTDEIITLQREDWEDFELIWNWLQNPGEVTYTIV